MTTRNWTRAPIEQTRAVRRVVLAVVHTVASGQRVLDTLSVVESDPAVQVVFTRPPDSTGGVLEEFLRRTAGVVILWEQAVEGAFDLVVSASSRHVAELTGPVLLLPDVSPRGVFPDLKGYDGVNGIKRAVGTPDGMSSVVALAHYGQRRSLLSRWPAAVRHAVVVGDPDFDRLAASVPHRERYRAQLGVEPTRNVVLAVSTRGPRSLFARSAGVLDRLIADLPPAEHLVLCHLHPDVWDVHGRRQVLAWTADARRAGLVLNPPGVDWRVAVIAADCVVGDHGLVTAYTASMGKPVVLAHSPKANLVPGSVTEALAAVAPVLDPAASLRVQLERAKEPVDGKGVTDRITSLPHRSAAVLRATCYRVLHLPEPTTPILSAPIQAD
ncbi:hypothetical protein ACTG9Q_06065 [Actinokineospora sp. 24-640]